MILFNVVGLSVGVILIVGYIVRWLREVRRYDKASQED